MRKIIAATAALASAAGMGLVATPAANAASLPVYNAQAHWSGTRTCADQANGITTRKLVLDNSGSNRRVQYKVVREGDPIHGHTQYIFVRRHQTRTVTVGADHGSVTSVRIRVPAMGRRNLIFSRRLFALRGCWTPVHDPRATVTSSCIGSGTLLTLDLDNEGNYREDYSWKVTNTAGGSSNGQQAVRRGDQGTAVAWLPAGATANVVVQAASTGKVFENASLHARACQ